MAIDVNSFLQQKYAIQHQQADTAQTEAQAHAGYFNTEAALNQYKLSPASEGALRGYYRDAYGRGPFGENLGQAPLAPGGAAPTGSPYPPGPQITNVGQPTPAAPSLSPGGPLNSTPQPGDPDYQQRPPHPFAGGLSKGTACVGGMPGYADGTPSVPAPQPPPQPDPNAPGSPGNPGDGPWTHQIRGGGRRYAQGTPWVQEPPGPGQTITNGSWEGPTNQPAPPAPVAFPLPAGVAPGTFGKRKPVTASKGMVKVPGKDQGVDTVPAVLRPREAVLVPGAADEVGRDNIAALNMKHNAIEAHSQAGQQSKPPAAKSPPAKAMTPAKGKASQRPPQAAAKGKDGKPAPKGGKQQELAHGTHMVKPGASAKTPKIDPGALQALMGMMGGGGGGMTPPKTGGMV